MTTSVYDGYPDVITHPDGLIIAFKIIPTALPKEGPVPCNHAVPFVVVYAANKSYTEEGGEALHHWEPYHFQTAEDHHQQDAYVLSLNLLPNRWYYIDDNLEPENELETEEQ